MIKNYSKIINIHLNHKLINLILKEQLMIYMLIKYKKIKKNRIKIY